LTTALWWVRRDLRLADNQALTTALSVADAVLPVFVLDPTLLNSPYTGAKRLAFLLAGLRQLDASLRIHGSRLIVRRGEPRAELDVLAAESGAAVILAEEDHSPYARRRDMQVAEALPLHLTGGVTVHPPGAVLKTGGTPYTVFTPFSRAWKTLPPPGVKDVLAAPGHLPPVPDLPSLPIPIEPLLPPQPPFPPGEFEAQRRLASFVDGNDPGIYRYAQGRDRLDLDDTSRLSPYLRFGMVSARQVVASARRAIDAAPDTSAREGSERWLTELIWREFYIAILHHFPEVRQQSFRPALRNIAWQNDEASFDAWCRGCTGYPVVDAAMRQVVHTGWMHNRARMVVASFLVKDLLVDWRWGERFFMQHLVDGDPAANNGGWQWTAGTGTDAAPYFRMFNPVLQGRKYDPEGRYVRRWVPELANVPGRYIHAPWEMPLDVQRQAGCIVGQDYPAPIVDHASARKRVLEAFGAARSPEMPLPTQPVGT
jgi:deoxyribodipyrimidine photo-lyase